MERKVTRHDNSKNEELAEALATYFNNISSEYTSLDLEKIPVTQNRSLPVLAVSDVSKALRTAKKKTAGVPGDISGHLYSVFPDSIAVPLSAIYNRITSLKQWPKQWKAEHVTVIPKCQSLDSFGDCRNISCINFLSKVYESFVLSWAWEEMKPVWWQKGLWNGAFHCGRLRLHYSHPRR